jgi:DNA-binding NtrC family response regulator
MKKTFRAHGSNNGLLDLLKVDETAGTIHFQHRRMLLFDADALGLLRKELIDGFGLERARRVLTRFGYACGYRDALTTKDLSAWGTDEEWWAAGPQLHTFEGIVRARPLRSRIERDKGVFDTEVEWLNSYEVEQHLRHVGPCEWPVCWTLTGYASGHSTAVFGAAVYSFEVECVGKGDARCRVVSKPAAALDESERALLAFYQEDDVEAELRRLLEALETNAKELARRERKVRALESQIVYLQEAINEEHNPAEIVGASPAFRQALAAIERVAPSDTTVLICGETGTGKDLIARAIHARSDRSGRPLVTVNCAALPTGLVESELFGHEKGAFTGAFQRKLGRFEIADGATIFLDEVGELPLETQAKLLRVLQSGEFERVGGAKTIKVNARVLAATNRRLDVMVAEGKFRSDLFYRLNVFPIEVPPLRERPEDVVLLTNYFVQRFRARLRKEITSIDQRSLERLRQYRWPGNVRELEHLIERAVLLADGKVLTIDLPLSAEEFSLLHTTSNAAPKKLMTMEEMERVYIEQVLRHTNGMIAGKGGAAEVLDLPPSTLRNRMKKLGLK